MPSAQDVYITPASSVIDIYSGSTKNLYLSGSSHGYIHGASDLKITADDDISLQGQSGGSIITFGTEVVSTPSLLTTREEVRKEPLAQNIEQTKIGIGYQTIGETNIID